LNRAPGAGYCELMTWDMTSVSNKDFCGSGAATTNVGFYARVTFPTCLNGTTYDFTLPSDGSVGGISMMDKAVK
jgi:hypothetical protein